MVEEEDRVTTRSFSDETRRLSTVARHSGCVTSSARSATVDEEEVPLVAPEVDVQHWRRSWQTPSVAPRDTSHSTAPDAMT